MEPGEAEDGDEEQRHDAHDDDRNEDWSLKMREQA